MTRVTCALFSIVALVAGGCGGSESPPAPVAADGAGVDTEPTDAMTIDSIAADASIPVADSTAVVDADAGPDAPGYIADCTEFLSKPAAGSWRARSKIGFPSSSSHRLFWTGTELLAVRWSDDARALKAYNPVSDTWRTIPIDSSAPTARSNPMLGVVDGKLWLYGGRTSSMWTPSGGVLDPATGLWTSIPSGAPLLYAGGDGPQIFGRGGKVMLLSTYASGGAKMAAILDQATSTWSSVEWPSDSKTCSDASLNGVEGICRGEMRATHRFSLSTPGVVPGPTAPGPVDVVAWAGARIFAWGGVDLSSPWEGALFEPTTSTWTKTAAGTLGRKFPKFASVGSKVAILGGTADDGVGAPRRDGAVYDPATDSWSRIPCDGAPSGVFLAITSAGNELYALVPGSYFGSIAL